MNSELLTVATAAVMAYAETHPRPLHVTQAQAAEMLDVSRHTVSKLVKAGTLRLNACGMILVGQIDAVLAARV